MRRLFRLSGREPSVESDVKAELESHLAMKTDALIRAGWAPAAAAEEARRQFGSVSLVERRTRAEATGTRSRRRWAGLAGGWLLDGRLAVRALRRAPGYTVMAALVLALGIGASVAVLAVADRLLLAPLSFPDAGRVMVMLELGRGGGARVPSYPTARDWQQQAEPFEAIGYVPGFQVVWRSPAGVESVIAAFPSSEFFSLLGTAPLLGRTLTPADDAAGARVAVLSHRLWQRRFGGDPAVIGTTVSLIEGPVTVVGVMPIGFQFPSWADLYLPMGAMSRSGQLTIGLRGNHADALVVGRLKPGISVEEAGSAMAVVARRLADEYPAEQADWTTVLLLPIRDYLYNPAQFGGGGLANPVRTVQLFIGAVALVLLIACANVAGLTLVRSQSRERELAVRSALGARRWQLIRQRLVESGIVAGLGAAAGLALAVGLLAAVKLALPELLPRLTEVRIDWRMIIAAAALAALAAVASGLVPALRATPTSLVEMVKAGAKGTRSRSQTAAQRALVALQLGLAVTLLTGAAVLVRSFIRVVDTRLGFDAERLIAITINPDRTKYPTAEATVELYRRLLAQVAAVPGVEQAGLTNHLPATGASLPTNLEVDGHVPVEGSPRPSANFRSVSPEYFDTIRVPIRRGRVFTQADLAGPNDGFVVNESLARRYWPDQDPVGRRITIFKSARWLGDFGQPMSGVVIGVVGDVRHFGAERAVPDEVYLPYTWNPWGWTGMVVRTTADPAMLLDPVWRAIAAVDPDIPIATGARPNIQTFEHLMAAGWSPRRLMTNVAGGVAGSALLLAVVGLYGLMAYLVNLRRREIGIRSALGADRRAIVNLVLRQGLGLAVTGTALGLVGGLLVASSLETLVFGVSVRDLAAFVTVPALLMGVAALATYLPARRASRLDPVEVLKGD